MDDVLTFSGVCLAAALPDLKPADFPVVMIDAYRQLLTRDELAPLRALKIPSVSFRNVQLIKWPARPTNRLQAYATEFPDMDGALVSDAWYDADRSSALCRVCANRRSSPQGRGVSEQAPRQ